VISDFFIERPLFATVVSAFIVIAGLAAFRVLPVSLYPDILPPQVEVTTAYPGASADVVAETVAAPLEQQINGVEDMLYVRSASSAQRRAVARGHVRGRHGPRPRRHQRAEPRAGGAAAAAGGSAPPGRHGAQDLAEHPAGRDARVAERPYDDLFVSNYALVNVVDELRRIPGVGAVDVFGAREYSMRVWLRPDRLAELGLTPPTSPPRSASRTRSSRRAARRRAHPQPRRDHAERDDAGPLSDPEQFENDRAEDRAGRCRSSGCATSARVEGLAATTCCGQA
jgi:hypothetical protein